MKTHAMIKRTLVALAAAAVLSPTLAAAQGPAAPAAQPPRSPKAAAPIDLTGEWVSIVNEDWIYRMLTPKKGDFPGLPMTKAATDAANAWDPATDGSCKAYGVGGVMRMPGRLKISWAADDVLRIETDAGVQTRQLIFGRRPDANTPATLQGYSVARWELPNGIGGGGGPGATPQRPPGGDLLVVTTRSTGGWVRKNGVPYSADARVTEYFDQFKGPDGAEWLTVLTEVDDPVNFNGPLLTSTHFKKEPDASKWRPRPCTP